MTVEFRPPNVADGLDLLECGCCYPVHLVNPVKLSFRRSAVLVCPVSESDRTPVRSNSALGGLVPQHRSNPRTIPDPELRQQSLDVIASGEVADP